MALFGPWTVVRAAGPVKCYPPEFPPYEPDDEPALRPVR